MGESPKELQEQVYRLRHLEAMDKELTVRCRDLGLSVQELEDRAVMEMADVERPEGRSLSALFYQIIGRREEKLDQERREACEARVRCDAAQKELAEAEAQLSAIRAERKNLRGCERRFELAMEERLEALRRSGTPAAEEVLRLEEKLAGLDAKEKERREAKQAGNAALALAGQAYEHLESAGSWGTWDLLGGGMLTDLAKHSELDEAQEIIERLQIQLRRFGTELADVSLTFDSTVRVDGFMRFADTFFDGLFADFAVMEKMEESRGRLSSLMRQIERILERLDESEAEAVRERAQLQADLEARIME